MGENTRTGRPMKGVVLDQEVLDLVESYKRGRGLRSMSAALGELVRYGLGENPHGHSAVEDYLPESKLKTRMVKIMDRLFPRRSKFK